MECYISKNDEWKWDRKAQRNVKVGETYKGFPIVSESQRKTAESWARTMQAIQIPERLENCGVDDFDDRMNNKIFKIYYMANYRGKKIKLYFDMYVPQMLDLMRNGAIEKEIIKVPLVFIDRSRLVMENGEFHKEYLEKEANKKALKETKAISVKDLKLGSCYSKTKDGQQFIYVGPVKGQGHLIIDLGWGGDELREPSIWTNGIKITKSLGFKFEHAEGSVKPKVLQDYIVKKRKAYNDEIERISKINEERMAEAKRRAEGSPSWGWSWQAYFSPQLIPDYSKEFETVNELENILSNVVDKQKELV